MPDCWETTELKTIAVAPELEPVNNWLITSWPSTPDWAKHLNVILFSQSPADVRITYSVG